MLNVLLLDNEEFVQNFFEKVIDKNFINLKQERNSNYLLTDYFNEERSLDLCFMNLYLENGYYIFDFLENNKAIISTQKIILMSPLADFQLFLYLFQIGIFDILQKPFSPSTVHNIIKNYKKNFS